MFKTIYEYNEIEYFNDLHEIFGYSSISKLRQMKIALGY